MRRKFALPSCILLIFTCTNFYFFFAGYITLSSTAPKRIDESQIVQFESYGEEYCVAYNITRNRRSFQEDGEEPVTLAIHSTAEYLDRIIEQLQSWNGPISLALFIDQGSQSSLNFQYNLHFCDPIFTDKLSLHVVFRLPIFSTKCPSVKIMPLPCQDFIESYKQEYLKKVVPPFTIYPINVMRNVARKGASSGYHLISDVEMVYSENFAEWAKMLAAEYLKNNKKNLIVIRRFELNETIKNVPRTIDSLKEQLDQKLAFQFHQTLFPQGHTIDELPQWFLKSNSTAPLEAWEIPYKSSSWEPQIIMSSTALYSEEKVPTRWRDHQALVYELCRANYTFLLASHLFNVHRGIKKKNTEMDNVVKYHQKRLRDRYFNAYNQRIAKQYGNDTKRCGKFIM